MGGPELVRVVALGFALAEVDHGVGEEGGNNEGERIRQYLAGAGISMAAPWCAAFVDYCFDSVSRMLRTTNPLDPVKLEAYVQNYADTLDAAKVDPSVAQPGDLVLYSFGGQRWDHIGIVLETPNSDGHFKAVEGNTSDENQRDGDAVAIKRRTLGTGRRQPLFIGVDKIS